MEDFSDIEKRRIALQNFQEKLNREPDPREFQDTPDGKAKTLPISFVEMTLDEIFLGLWDTEKFKYQQVFNEVIGSIELIVTHPITGGELRRTGAASVVITQDANATIADFNMTKKKNAGYLPVLELEPPVYLSRREGRALVMLEKVQDKVILRPRFVAVFAQLLS